MSSIASASVLALGLVGVGCACGESHELPDAGLGERDAVALEPDALFPDDARTSDARGPGTVALSRCGALGGDFVSATAISPDGRWIATAGFERVTLIDAATGLEVRTLGTSTGRSGGAKSLAFSADGRTVYLGNSDGVRVLSTDDGSVIRDVRVARGCCGVSHVAFALEAGVALAYSEGFRLVHLDTGVIDELPITGPFSEGFDVSPDGRLGAFVDEATVVLIELATASTVRRIDAPPFTSTIDFSPDGALLAISLRRPDRGAGEILRVASVEGSDAPRALRDESSTLLGDPIAWTHDGAGLVVGAPDRVLEVGVPADGGALALLASHPSPVPEPYTVGVDEGGRAIASARHVAAFDEVGALRFLRAAETSTVPHHPFRIDDEGRVLADGVLWDPSTQLALRVLSPRDGAAVLADDGEGLAFVSEGALVVEDATGSARTSPLDFAPTTLLVRGDEVLLASAARLEIRARDDLSVRVRRPLSLDAAPLLLERSPSGALVMVGALERAPVVIDRASDRDVTPTPLTGDIARSAAGAYFLDEHRIASALAFHPGLRVVDLDGTVQELRSVMLVRAVAPTSFGELVALGLDDTLTVYDAASFEARTSIETSSASVPVQALAIAPSGGRMAWAERGGIALGCVARD